MEVGNERSIMSVLSDKKQDLKNFIRSGNLDFKSILKQPWLPSQLIMMK